MPTYSAFIALTLTLAAGSRLATAQRQYVYPNCAIVTFECEASATNYNFSPDVVNTTLLNQTITSGNYSKNKTVSQSSKIVGRYCEPENYVASQADQIEFLLHGVTYNKLYWSGLGEPGHGYGGNDSYSWLAYASKAGYATLAIDRLGNGQSDHPDPLFVAQGPYEYALYRAISQQVKAGPGSGSPLPKAYGDVMLVAHSYGSEIVENMAALYPNDWSTIVLTGFTASNLVYIPGILLGLLPLPAAVVDSKRFGNLQLGYVTTTGADGRRIGFYGTQGSVDYDYDLTNYDDSTRDVISIGQLLTVLLKGSTVAHKYPGRVLVLTGEEDNIFCGPGNALLLGIDLAKCGQAIPNSRSQFPSAKEYSWYSVARTGHDINLHYSRQESFKVVHDFLGGKKFSKSG